MMSRLFTDNHNFRHPVKENHSMNERYKRKYNRIKRIIKDLVFENAALCDQVSQMQEKILIVKEERRYLLKKLYHLQALAEADSQLQIHAPKLQSSGISPTSSVDHSSSVKKSSGKKRTELLENIKTAPKGKKSGSVKVKKLVQPIPLDITGRPVFPIILGGLTVHSLGEVVSDRPDYHTEELIFPVGFCSTRTYGGLKDPEKKCVYTCKVLDGGSTPIFEIVADNNLDAPIVSKSVNECHALLLQHINRTLGFEVVKTHGKGPEFFGLSHPTIQNLIQSSPGTRKCLNYKWSKFEVSRTGEPPPEETDPSLNFEALQRSVLYSKSHLVTVKEDPDQLLRDSNATLRDLLMS